ncbi:hypothetical protein IMZ48_49460 [Candidatus Bathyarchaeota archaeon]|nr:hypothetical protein [Candidatus Bathyarchaeota archaeon]
MTDGALVANKGKVYKVMNDPLGGGQAQNRRHDLVDYLTFDENNDASQATLTRILDKRRNNFEALTGIWVY